MASNQKMPMLPEDKGGIKIEGEQPVEEKKEEAPKKASPKKKKEE